MSTPGRAPLRAFARRRAPRCPLTVPVRVTVLRSGTAYSIPGRSVDLGEGGIAVVLGGEVHLTDRVGVEFLLPDLGLGLQTKAIVRHHSPLRCGFEFTELTRHQQAVIREWARQKLQTSPSGAAKVDSARSQPDASSYLSDKGSVSSRRRLWWMAAGALALAGLLMWWQWQRGWRELEERIPQHTGQVPAIEVNHYLAVLASASRQVRSLPAAAGKSSETKR